MAARRSVCPVVSALIGMTFTLLTGCQRLREAGVPGLGADTPAVATASCEAVPPWRSPSPGGVGAYEPGDHVQNRGQVYACTEWGDGRYCNQDAFEPGTATEHLWRDAWQPQGSCIIPDATFSGNRLALVLPPMPPGTTPGPITGTVRCVGNNPAVRSFTGGWGQSITVDDLGRCDYQLYIEGVGGQLPLNTPALLPFTETAGQVITFEAAFRPEVPLEDLVLAPGVTIEVFATGLLQPRQMAMGANVLYVGSSAIPHFAYDKRIADFIYALPLDGTGKPTGVQLLATHLQEPHGVAYRDGNLYFSSTGGLYRINAVDSHLDNPVAEKLMVFPADDTRMKLPPSGDDGPYRVWHQKHPLYFNPNDPADDSLYTAVGIPCNICKVPQDTRYGSVLKYNVNSGESTLLATGVRNAVGLAWHPDSGQIWFSDNNRQGFPNTDEINRISRTGEFFGVPYVFGKATLGYTQAEFDDPRAPNDGKLLPGAIISDLLPEEIDIRRQTQPVYPLASNSAPLGIHFWNRYPAPPGGRQLLVAQHGGGTAEDPSTDVRMLTVINNKVVHDVPLITGWKPASGAFTGKPVDFLELPDGSLLISDDVAGVIYKVTYAPESLPGTTLSFEVAATAPLPALAEAKPSGVLTDASGRQRLVQLGWGAPALTFQGLAPGEYAFDMRDAGAWVPVTRHQTVTLAADGGATVDLAYREPVQVKADIIIKAPPRPANVTAPQWTVHLRTTGDSGDGLPLAVDWGGELRHEVGNGEYSVVFPYFDAAMPTPTLEKVYVDENSGDRTVAPAYTPVDSLGKIVLENTCSGCHQPLFWDNGELAERWDSAGVDVLIAKIESMGVPGHCDRTCSSATARYLLDTVWGDFLDPPPSVGTRQVRLLATDEYVNAVQDVLKFVIDKADVPPENTYKSFKYPAPAAAGLVRKEPLYQYYLLARKVAQGVDLESLGYIPGNDPTAFVGSIGRLMFRRPLSPAELDRYKAVLDTPDGDMEAPRLMLAGMLMSPHFLYRQELGQAIDDGSGDYLLDPYETATALSFAYLGTTPDDALLTKAANGELSTQEQIIAAASDMMQSPKGLAQFERFVRYYTRTLQTIGEKPGLGRPLIDAMAQEQSLSVRYLMDEGSGNVRDLFNPAYTYLNQALAQHYGVGGVSGDQMQRVPLAPGGDRGGLLHQGQFQITQSGQDTTGLIPRGFRIREQFFCHVFGTPIADPGNPQFPDHGVTMRYRWDLINGKYADETCWNCHKFVNDTGASMENYDWTGKFRTQEFAVNPPYTAERVDLDATLNFLNASDTGYWGTNLRNVRGIAELIPDNPSAMSCLVDGYLRYTLGTEVTPNVISLHSHLRRQLMEDGDMRRMLLDIAASPSFTRRKEIVRTVRVGPPANPPAARTSPR